jgi:hypothetical protein
MSRIFVDPRLVALPQFRACRRRRLERVSGLQTITNRPAGAICLRGNDESAQVLLVLAGLVGVRDKDVALVVLGPGELVSAAPGIGPDLGLTSTVYAETDVVFAAMNCREFRAVLALMPRLLLEAPIPRRADGPGERAVTSSSNMAGRS